MKKYKLGKLEYVDKTRWLYRIIALKDFADVKKGDIGGFIKSENNLSQEGNCWIYDNAEVMDNALVQGNARIVSNAMISRNAFINENAIVGGHAKVSDNAEIYGHAYIGDNAEVVGFSLIGGYTRCLKNNIYNNIKLAEEKNEDEEVQIEEINKILMKEFGKTVDDFLEEINDSLETHDNTKEKFLSTMAALTSLNKLIK
ncbi:MAG: hypothetical protein DBY41_04375 [Clostridium sp.]|nr:MAG: hypothetical protein DBY41_04375 [Clostridium sp.]